LDPVTNAGVGDLPVQKPLRKTRNGSPICRIFDKRHGGRVSSAKSRIARPALRGQLAASEDEGVGDTGRGFGVDAYVDASPQSAIVLAVGHRHCRARSDDDPIIRVRDEVRPR
jgi:hypothetical protein